MQRRDAAASRPTLSELIVEWRWAVLILWAALVLGATPLALELGGRLEVVGEVPSGEATAVRARIANDFARNDARMLALVVSDLTDSAEARDLDARIVAAFEALDGIGGVDVRRSKSGGNDSLILVRLGDVLDDRVAFESLRTAATELLERSWPRFAAAQLSWTGEIAVRQDIITAASKDLRRSEIRALPLTLGILCFVFGALVAVALPLGVGLLATVLTLALAGLMAQLVTISVMVQSVASLLGLALGVDYALLMVSQFRRELAGAVDARAAAIQALRQCGRTVLVSGAAVAVGFAGLVLLPVENLRSIGIAGVAVAGFAALLTTTALPAVLSLLGDRVDRGRLWRRRDARTSERWFRWAAVVCDHPWQIVFGCTLPLLVLGSMSRDLAATFPSDAWLPPQAESIEALSRLEEFGVAGIMNRLLVLYELPEGTIATQPSGVAALRRLHAALSRDARTESVLSAATALRLTGAFRAPEAALDAYLSADRRTALLELRPVANLGTGSELTGFVRDIRALDLESVAGPGGRISVGGTPAATADYEDLVDLWLPRVIAIVAAGSFVVLAVAFRSLVIPLKAVALNLLSVFAAYGTIALVFVHGFGAGLLGLAGPIEGVFPPTPIIVFCAAFGISMDYEVFLLSRIAAARRLNADERECIVEGVAGTGRLITSAAAIMVVVFAAFAFGDVLPTQILGAALAVVVAIDALLIRMALGPAIIRIAGRWNWWPGRAGFGAA